MAIWILAVYDQKYGKVRRLKQKRNEQEVKSYELVLLRRHSGILRDLKRRGCGKSKYDN